MAKGRKLDFEVEKVTWRMRRDNIELMRVVHPDVNEVVRVLVDRYCDQLRARLAGHQ